MMNKVDKANRRGDIPSEGEHDSTDTVVLDRDQTSEELNRLTQQAIQAGGKPGSHAGGSPCASDDAQDAKLATEDPVIDPSAFESLPEDDIDPSDPTGSEEPSHTTDREHDSSHHGDATGDTSVPEAASDECRFEVVTTEVEAEHREADGSAECSQGQETVDPSMVNTRPADCRSEDIEDAEDTEANGDARGAEGTEGTEGTEDTEDTEDTERSEEESDRSVKGDTEARTEERSDEVDGSEPGDGEPPADTQADVEMVKVVVQTSTGSEVMYVPLQGAVESREAARELDERAEESTRGTIDASELRQAARQIEDLVSRATGRKDVEAVVVSEDGEATIVVQSSDESTEGISSDEATNAANEIDSMVRNSTNGSISAEEARGASNEIDMRAQEAANGQISADELRSAASGIDGMVSDVSTRKIASYQDLLMQYKVDAIAGGESIKFPSDAEFDKSAGMYFTLADRLTARADSLEKKASALRDKAMEAEKNGDAEAAANANKQADQLQKKADHINRQVIKIADKFESAAAAKDESADSNRARAGRFRSEASNLRAQGDEAGAMALEQQATTLESRAAELEARAADYAGKAETIRSNESAFSNRSPFTEADNLRFQQAADRALGFSEGKGWQTGGYTTDNQIGKLEMQHAGVDAPLDNAFIRSLGDGNGFLNKDELVQAQKDGLINIDEEGRIGLTAQGAWEAKAWNAISQVAHNADGQLSRSELSSAGLNSLESKFLSSQTGNGRLDRSDLAQAQKNGLITISDDGKIALTREAGLQAKAWNAIKTVDGNSDGVMGSKELTAAGMADEAQNSFLLSLGAEGTLDEKALIQAQKDGIVTIGDDGQVSLTGEGKLQANAWNAIRQHDSERRGANGSFTVGANGIDVTINASSSGYDNKIVYSTDGWKTSKTIGVDNQDVGQVKHLDLPPGTEVSFGIINGEGKLFKMGEGAGNSDGKVHAKETTGDGFSQIGFEDLSGGGDNDFDDAMFEVRQGKGGDGQLGMSELKNAGVTGDLQARYLGTLGNGDGKLSQQELVQAQKDGLITISSTGKIELTQEAQFDALAKNAIRKNEGTGVNIAPYNNDNQLGKWELHSAGVVDQKVNNFLRGLGDNNGFLNHAELMEAQKRGLITINEDGRIAATDAGKAQAGM
jgi:hypothetical protein